LAQKRIRHLRHHARKYDEAHKSLKELLSRALYIEKIWDAFVAAFVITIITIVLFMNWGRIAGFFIGSPTTEIPGKTETLAKVEGFKTGVFTTYQINGQTADQYIRYIRQIPGGGYKAGLTAVEAVGKPREEKPETSQNTFMDSIMLSTNLSKGYHLTPVRKAGSLQKSVLATYYFGEKTITLNSTLQSDTKLLSEINNTLSVDIFAYLNQSSSRATSLDSYIHLLETLNDKAKARSQDLASVVNFLTANSKAQDTSINLTEDAFFANLKIFNGSDAETQLGQFIGMQKDLTETKAKIGAYKGLKQYYDFFLPKLDNLIRAINANRDPLIAGVKVVEVQNMTLPLIIKER